MGRGVVAGMKSENVQLSSWKRTLIAAGRMDKAAEMKLRKDTGPMSHQLLIPLGHFGWNKCSASSLQNLNVTVAAFKVDRPSCRH